MVKYLCSKFVQMIIMLFALSFVIFCALDLTGVDPIDYMVASDIVNAIDDIELLREELGLNGPVVSRYFSWLSEVLSGNLGYSLITGNKITDTLSGRLSATFELSFWALILSTTTGILIGIVSAIRQNGIVDYIGRVFSVLGQSIPQFFCGVILVQVFATSLGWLPPSGRMSPGGGGFMDRLTYLVLPVMTLTLAMTAVIMSYTRSTMLSVLNSDYIKTARSKGIPEWKVYTQHALINAIRPVLVIVMFRLPMLVSGAVVVETVFGWPGIGSTLITAVIAGDYPIILITTLMIAVAILISSFLLDILNALLDPRIRFDE
ncbi:MAG: peptide ABC transporter permease [Epulopiscium sp. Nele67-Bin004]|nr:MAG: peptide ABC transporter permease [Epulopiscium sp. Nele67-Bin004]